MKNSDEVLDLLETIAFTSSLKEKEAYLHLGDDMVRRVLWNALNPFRRFYIAKTTMPERVAASATGDCFTEETFKLLDALVDRTLSGDAAIAAVQAEINKLSAKSAELLKRVILKDLRANFGETLTNKVFPGLIPEFSYMRCSLPKHVKLDKWPWESGIISEEKADGMFCNINHHIDGSVSMLTRQGSEFPLDAFGEMVAAIKLLLPVDSQSHGELLVEEKGVVLAREIGNGILNHVLSGGSFDDGQRPVCAIWDQIPFSAAKPKGKYERPYVIRLTAIRKQLSAGGGCPLSVVPYRIVKSLDEAYDHYFDLLAKGKEGTIIKLPTAIWKDGTSREQIKLKLEVDVDLRIVGFNPGEGKNRLTFGSIIYRSDCGELEVNVSGFTDKERERIWSIHTTLIDTIGTVRANSIMKPSKEGGKHSLFLPRHVEFRTDKTNADTLQQIKDQFDSAVKAKA